ncbi:hypothetical protein J6590_003375 [Homalodisca vitripennis]|nr:hypothetical protein J6590_003375 [Homalodisca vitripennis]
MYAKLNRYKETKDRIAMVSDIVENEGQEKGQMTRTHGSLKDSFGFNEISSVYDRISAKYQKDKRKRTTPGDESPLGEWKKPKTEDMTRKEENI